MIEVKNYRRLSIGASMSWIITRIVNKSLKENNDYTISEAQYAFRKNKSTSNWMIIVKATIEKHAGPLIAMCIDLTAVYNHVQQDFLFKMLEIQTSARTWLLL